MLLALIDIASSILAQHSALSVQSSKLQMQLSHSPDVATGFYKALKTMGMDPGLEFKVALEEAEKLNARLRVALHD